MRLFGTFMLVAGLAALGGCAAHNKEALTFVKDHIHQHKLTVFSKTYCGYSMRAKTLLRSLVDEDALHIVEVDEQPDAAAVQFHLGDITGQHTVPRIFINGHCIGGSDDIHLLHKEGKLVPLLKKAGLAIKDPPKEL